MINVDFIDSSEVTTERIYQWDIGRKLKISNIGSAVAPVVHFCNKKSENALAVESITSGDSYIASIPNSLLQEEYDIIAYIYVGSEEEAKTIKVLHIPVTKRLKPESYVTTEDENVVDFLAISAEMRYLLNGLVITEYDSAKSYIKPNIVYYNGCSYICKSETTISNVLPTDTTKWGLMCKNGANISQITFSDDALHFKLESNDIIDVPLGSIEINVLETEPVAFNITQDDNGVLKIGDEIISKKQLIWSNDSGDDGVIVGSPILQDGTYQFDYSISIVARGESGSGQKSIYSCRELSKYIKVSSGYGSYETPIMCIDTYTSSSSSSVKNIFMGNGVIVYSNYSLSLGASTIAQMKVDSTVSKTNNKYDNTMKLYKIYKIIE